MSGRPAGPHELLRHLFGHFGRGNVQLGAAGGGHHLRLAGALHVVHVVKGIGNRGAAGQEAVIAQDHHIEAAEVAHQALLLVQIQRDAFVVVIGDAIPVAHRVLGQGQQALLLRRHRQPGLGVGVHHAGDIGPRPMHRAVDHITGLVDAVTGGVLDDLAIQRHLDQAGGGDLVEHQAVGVDQEMMLRPRHARRNVGEDQVGHAVRRRQPITGGERHPLLPLFGGNAFLQRGLADFADDCGHVLVSWG